MPELVSGMPDFRSLGCAMDVRKWYVKGVLERKTVEIYHEKECNCDHPTKNRISVTPAPEAVGDPQLSVSPWSRLL